MADEHREQAVAHHQTVHLFQKKKETLDEFMARLAETRKREYDAVGHPRIDTTLASTPPAARVRQDLIDAIQSMLPPDTHLELIAEDLDDIFEDDLFEFGEEDDETDEGD